MWNLILALNAATLVLVFSLFIRSWLQNSRTKKSNEQLTQHLRELLLTDIGNLKENLAEKFGQTQLAQAQQASDLKEQLKTTFAEHRSRFDERQIESLKLLQDTLQKGVQDSRQQVKEALGDYAKDLGTRMNQLTEATENRLKEINQHVEKRLADGFEKTNETFNDVIKRLAMIDAAQQKITELSSNVVSLQEILSDKRSRGAFGEIQLSALIHNMLPEQHFSFQHTLSNQKRADCMLFLPEPTGNIVIDAKFPLENYRHMIDASKNEAERVVAERQFKIDIKKHIQDIADKYIIPGETADGAVMFIPAEAVFAEIHAHHSDLVQLAQQHKVWLVSPTTMMAILTTARAVLKDAATRQQVHEIQKHLRHLSEDFERFQIRMDNLAKRIAQTHADVEQVHISSRKISQRFVQIERAELDPVSLAAPIVSLATGEAN
ncbi:MAG TPA: DNA recombination protein RmuC [Gammaproteobacteria bacterium]|jgi:DNA recombination protein RmuC|nr:DNA recombination protein RmuC [Gammaproteobacteria bacterium]